MISSFVHFLGHIVRDSQLVWFSLWGFDVYFVVVDFLCQYCKCLSSWMEDRPRDLSRRLSLQIPGQGDMSDSFLYIDGSLHKSNCNSISFHFVSMI